MNFGFFSDLVLGLDHFCFVVFYLLEIIVFDFFPSFFGLGRLCISGVALCDLLVFRFTLIVFFLNLFVLGFDFRRIFVYGLFNRLLLFFCGCDLLVIVNGFVDFLDLFGGLFICRDLRLFYLVVLRINFGNVILKLCTNISVFIELR